jgi:hypothetical protein
MHEVRVDKITIKREDDDFSDLDYLGKWVDKYDGDLEAVRREGSAFDRHEDGKGGSGELSWGFPVGLPMRWRVSNAERTMTGRNLTVSLGSCLACVL